MARHGVLHLQLLRAVTALLSRVGTANIFLMYTKDLTEPLTPCAAAVPIEIGVARGEDLTAAAALYHHADAARVPRRAAWFRERVRDGSHCFVARVDGEMVAYNWIRVDAAVGARDLPMHLAPNEIYTTDAYTARAWRGKGIHTALNYAMLQIARDSGYRTAYTLLRVSNLRSWVTMPRVGWKLAGTLLFFRPRWTRDYALWHVRGDPYPMPLRRGLQRREAEMTKARERAPSDSDRVPVHDALNAAALRWARQRFPFDRHEPIDDRPWYTTYRLHGGERVGCLRIVPCAQADHLEASAILAHRLPEAVPRVIARESRRGWLLALEHENLRSSREATERDLFELLESYARIQRVCMDDSELCARLPKVDDSRTFDSLLDFLSANACPSSNDHRCDAAYFLGERASNDYRRALARRRALLERHMATAHELPGTVNHGDLRLTNTALRVSGGWVLSGWSDAVCGPAGHSLHALFGGCFAPNRLLIEDGDPVACGGRRGRLLQCYIDALIRGGYADESSLRRCLPASITSGAVRHLARFSDCARAAIATPCTIGRDLRRRLDDLLDLCDFLSSRSRRTAMASAMDHREAGRLERAQRVLQACPAARTDASVATLLGSVLIERGHPDGARRAFRRAMDIDPDSAEPHERLGLLLMAEMECEQATVHLRRALELEPERETTRVAVARALRMQRSWERIRSLNGKRRTGERAGSPDESLGFVRRSPSSEG